MSSIPLRLAAAQWAPGRGPLRTATLHRQDPGIASRHWAVRADLTPPPPSSSCPTSHWRRQCDDWTLSEPCDLLLWIWESPYIESTLIKVIQHHVPCIVWMCSVAFYEFTLDIAGFLRISLNLLWFAQGCLFLFVFCWTYFLITSSWHICGYSVTSSFGRFMAWAYVSW